MRPELAIPLALLVAAAVTYAVTPLMIRVARTTGFLDKPAGYKGHGNPTPYLGGSAIMIGLLVAAVAYEGTATHFGVLGVCAIALWIVGTADDRLNISPLLRLGLEIAIACVLYATGNGWSALDIGPLDLLLTIVWVVGIVNAVNLMDNMDGAAASVVGISAIGTGALAVIAGDTTLAALCMGLAGACAGFLPRNLARPSRIFMGDGGSMPLGLLIAGASMKVASAGGLGAAGVLEAALILGLVILDTLLVTFSRRRGGRPPLTRRPRPPTHPPPQPPPTTPVPPPSGRAPAHDRRPRPPDAPPSQPPADTARRRRVARRRSARAVRRDHRRRPGRHCFDGRLRNDRGGRRHLGDQSSGGQRLVR